MWESEVIKAGSRSNGEAQLVKGLIGKKKMEKYTGPRQSLREIFSCNRHTILSGIFLTPQHS